jgi:hypothetical protein
MRLRGSRSHLSRVAASQFPPVAIASLGRSLLPNLSVKVVWQPWNRQLSHSFLKMY